MSCKHIFTFSGYHIFSIHLLLLHLLSSLNVLGIKQCSILLMLIVVSDLFSIQIVRYLIISMMNDTISAFLKEGVVHSTNKSHRTAASAYYTFLLNRITSRDPIQLSDAQYQDHLQWKPNVQPHLPPKSLTDDTCFALFLVHTLKQIEKKLFAKPTLRARQGWITWAIGLHSLDNASWTQLKTVKEKIARTDLIKNYKSKKAKVPPPQVHVRLADANVISSLENALAVVIYELGVFCARRQSTVHNFTTQNITYESNRMIGTDLKPRVSLDILANKEDNKGEIRDASLHGTRETVFSCRCKGSHNKEIPTGDCPIRAFATVWRYRTALYKDLQKTYRGKEDFENY